MSSFTDETLWQKQNATGAGETVGKEVLSVLKFSILADSIQRHGHPTFVTVFGNITLNQDTISPGWPRKWADSVFRRTENHISVSRESKQPQGLDQKGLKTGKRVLSTG